MDRPGCWLTQILASWRSTCVGMAKATATRMHTDGARSRTWKPPSISSLAQPRVDPQRIGALGLSVGGEQVIDAAASDRRLRAVVSEGAGERSIRETLLFGAPAALVIPQQAILTAAVAVFSGDGVSSAPRRSSRGGRA